MRVLLSCFSSFSGNLISKSSPPVSRGMLGVFIYTLNADGKYPLQGSENLQLPFQMQLCEKEKLFSELFVAFLESTSIFKDFELKDYCHS